MNYLTTGLVVVIALLGGFYGGYRFESAKITTTAGAAAPVTTTTGRGTGAFGGAAGAGGGGGAGGFAGAGGFGGRGSTGTVTNLTSTGFTIHTAAGTDIKVVFAAGTGPTVRKTVTGQLGDIQDGTTVSVAGQRDASGSLTATVVTILPVPSPSPGA